MKIRSFRDLRVWQVGMDLVEAVYGLTRAFPTHETYGLISQIRRAAVSIASNIAEGHTRHHLNEYLQHLSIAQASLAELDTQLEIVSWRCYCALSRAMPYARVSHGEPGPGVFGTGNGFGALTRSWGHLGDILGDILEGRRSATKRKPLVSYYHQGPNRGSRERSASYYYFVT